MNKNLSYLFSIDAVKDKANKILQAAEEGKTHFSVNWDKLNFVSEYVVNTTKENYPSLNIPYHSRWRHFDDKNTNRTKDLNQKISHLSKEEQTVAKLDLAIISVLLDAGAGDKWKYIDQAKNSISRSEGLAVASFEMFMQGSFSSDKEKPLQVDSEKLLGFSADDINIGFKVTEQTPLKGVEGRSQLLNLLGKSISNNKENFSKNNLIRPGNLLYALLEKYPDKKIPAQEYYQWMVFTFSTIWPSRHSYEDHPLGDTWPYSPWSKPGSIDELVPFHKLSTWLMFSLMEPLEEMGIEILNMEELPPLAEYRNGGLLLDLGLINLKDQSLLEKQHPVDSDLIIEWRALTIALIPKIAKEVAKLLNKNLKEFPLPKVLEGGTWSAGRKIAQEKRKNQGSGPPLNIQSDGTVF
jgi:hypothetical protein